MYRTFEIVHVYPDREVEVLKRVRRQYRVEPIAVTRVKPGTLHIR